MVMNEKELIERDSERDVWQETLDSVRSIKAGNVGNVETVNILPVVEARQKTGLSQSRFAELLGVSVRTLQDWEQGRRKPSRAAISLIQIAKQRPDILREVFG
jgi:putative transcriptional regulator